MDSLGVVPVGMVVVVVVIMVLVLQVEVVDPTIVILIPI